jgi:putative heme iron utilization protein
MFDDFKKLLQDSHEASLGTIHKSHPYVSLVGYLFESKLNSFGTLIFLLSDLAQHTQNLKLNSNISLLVAGAALDVPVFEKKRLTLSGSVQLIEDKKRFLSLKSDYVKRYPKSEIFFTLPDFKFYEFSPTEIHAISGFAQTTHLSLRENGWQKVLAAPNKS